MTLSYDLGLWCKHVYKLAAFLYTWSVKLEIIRGLTMPFFPMRPKSGRKIVSKADVLAIFERILEGYTVQLKLNGDRAEVGVTKAGVHIANRHGSWYKLPVLLDEFKALPPGTVLDGEVYKKKFYPFEVLAFDGVSLLRSTPEEREAKAKEVCTTLGIPWLYTPTLEVLSNLGANMPMIEGVVLKRAKAAYVPLPTAERESADWIKWKWA